MYTPSKQKWLERNRAPRVQISYDVETAGAIEKKELPLVVGIFSDLAGMPATVVPLAARRFVEIDRDSFDNVMAKIGPSLTVSRLTMSAVPGVALDGEIRFNKIDDFDPEHIAMSVPGLEKLFKTRNDLRDLMAKLDGNAKLDGGLSRIFIGADGIEIDPATRDKELEMLGGVRSLEDSSGQKDPAARDPDKPGEQNLADDNKIDPDKAS